VYNNLGAVYEIENDTQEARTYYKRAIASSCQATNKSVGIYFNNYALSCNKLGEHAEAEEYFLKAIDVLKSQYGSYNKYIATCLSSLSTLFLTRATSKSLADEGIVGPGHEHNKGLLARAENMAKEALHLKEMYFGRHHPEIIGSINVLADILRKQGGYERSEKLLFRALSIAKLQPQSFCENTMSSIDILVSLYLDCFDFPAAGSACQESFELKKLYYGLNDQRTIRTSNRLNNIKKLTKESKSDDITWAILDKTLGPLVEKNYMPVPFPFLKFIILIVIIYYLTKVTIDGSSVLFSIVSAGLIIGAYNKITHRKAENDEQ
jgi:tetratricopeptide (TPR) repeat protein